QAASARCVAAWSRTSRWPFVCVEAARYAFPALEVASKIGPHEYDCAAAARGTSARRKSAARAIMTPDTLTDDRLRIRAHRRADFLAESLAVDLDGVGEHAQAPAL